MKKHIPAGWSVGKMAFFAGLISSHLGHGFIAQIAEAINVTHEPKSEAYFVSFLKLLEPYIRTHEWDECIANVERMMP
jgi:hypothetical protein